LGLEVPAQFDGRVLRPLLDGEDVEWRHSAHYEWDYRNYFIASATTPWPFDRSLSRRNLAVGVSDDVSYVQFGDGSYRCYDLALDPTWRTECTDTERILGAAQEMLLWRQEHLGREFTDLLLEPGRPGRWPVDLHAT
jgi:hypothetical protein